MEKPKEFEELKTESEYCLMCQIETDHWADQEFSEWKIKEVICQAKKDAWNAAIRCAAESCEFCHDKQLILTRLID